MSEKVKKPFYQRTWFIVLAIILVSGACTNFGSDEEPPVLEVVDPEVVEVDTPDYEVIEKESYSIVDAERFGWHVVVKDQVTIEQLTEITESVVDEAKNEEDFNAFVVFYYDYAEYIGYGMVLGKAEFAPDGDWSKADTVEPGEYDKMEFEYDFMDKDWNKQLSEEEVSIFKAWHDLYDSKVTETDLPDEDEVNNEIAKEYSMEADEVREIIVKQIEWAFNDIE